MGIDEERERVWKAIGTTDDRVTQVRDRFDRHIEALPGLVKEAVQDAMPVALLTDEEYRSVQLLIRQQEQQLAFRNAVIEKSLTGLIWAGIVGLGIIFKSFIEAHGWKP